MSTPKTPAKQLLDMVRDPSLAPSDRGDALIYHIAEHGIDYRPVVHQLVQDADFGLKERQRKEQEGESVLAVERFLGTFKHREKTYAMVTRGVADMCLPAADEQVKDCHVGDGVLIDLKAERIVGLDGFLPVSGEIVPVDSRPEGKPDHVVVSHHDHLQLARLHHRLREHPELCQPGAQVIYDPLTRFVLDAVSTGSDGEELLTDPASLATVRRADIGCPKPVVDEMLDRVRHFLEHPDWVEKMQVRLRCSYLLVGCSGSGKSYHLKLFATELHDLVEKYTGQRSSRLVMVDASQFWTPLFGATEERISRWAEKLENLGRRTLRGRDGRELRFPLLVVLEEAEALLRSRGDQTGSGHLFDRPLALLLQKTESLENALGVPIIWVATSNRADLVDAAALRRMGMRQVTFGTLRAAEAVAVLHKKVPAGMPVCSTADPADARQALVTQVLGYLYGPEPKQGIAEIQLASSQRRTLNRSDVVTPAVLEEAVSYAVDRCLRKSERAGRLLGLDAEDVIAFLHRYFGNLARTLRPHNVAEHCPEWFAREPLHVTNVVPLMTDYRRPAALMLR